MTDILVCSDRNMLAALHTCLLSAVESSSAIRIHLLHQGITDADLTLLRKTLGDTELLPYTVDIEHFEHLPKMVDSLAQYFRLIAPTVISAKRIVYIDTDTLIGVDLAEVAAFDLGEMPAAMVPEAPATHAVDQSFHAHPISKSHSHYFNTGVVLINSATWREQRVTERCLEFLNQNEAHYFDQTAINIILGKTCPALPTRFNCIANQRCHWPLSTAGNILHFVDRPKPWDTGARLIHPQAHLWWPVFQRTALNGHNPMPTTATGGPTGYKKTLKDFLLTTALRAGIVSRVKGMP